MAAQALVRPSYADPLGTFATNVMGTANVLQAVRAVPSVRAALVVTSDKVYENEGSGRPFTEDDRLGGHDPYSSSKACAEIVAAFLPPMLLRRRAAGSRRRGRATSSAAGTGRRSGSCPISSRPSTTGEPVALRYPQAVRPWQHVLDPLAGYLMLAQAMVTDPDGAPVGAEFRPGRGQLPLGVGARPGVHRPLGRAPGLAARRRRASARGVAPHPRCDARPRGAGLAAAACVRRRGRLDRRLVPGVPQRRGRRRRHAPADRDVRRAARRGRRAIGCSCGGRHEGRHPRRRLRHQARRGDRQRSPSRWCRSASIRFSGTS